MLKKKLLTDRDGDLADQIMEEKIKELANEMDREILWNMLESLGWKRVILPHLYSIEDLKEIHSWIDNNIIGSYEKNRRDFIFESKKDATWFALRWIEKVD